MRAEELGAIPAHPATVGEWEELLLRMEVMPRVVRNTLEGGPDGARVREVLRALVEREAEAGAWLEEVTVGGRPERLPDAAVPADAGSPRLAERFASIRARDFVMLQRRGVEVWGWGGGVEGGEATVHQVVAWLVRQDAAALAALRAALRSPPVAC